MIAPRFSLPIGRTTSIEVQPITMTEYITGVRLQERLEQAFIEYAELVGIDSSRNYCIASIDEYGASLEWHERWSHGGEEYHEVSMPSQFLFDRMGWAAQHAPKYHQALLAAESAPASARLPRKRVCA